MKKIIFYAILIVGFVGFSQQQTITYSISPPTFEENQAITITINGSSVNEAIWAVTGNALYLWAWSFNLADTAGIDSPTNGTWINSNEAHKFTYNSGTDTYTYTLTPNAFYNRTGIGRIGFLVKAKNGTGDKKSQDNFAEVGLLQLSLSSPAANSSTIIASNGSLNIAATNTNGPADYNLKSNGISINTATATSTYSFNHTALTANQSYELVCTQGAVSTSKFFSAIVNPGALAGPIPAGLEDGINYPPNDNTKAFLVLDAPGKDFVYVAGSFNNWQPDTNYAMKKDPTSGKFWIELTGLVAGVSHSYQYWVVDSTPVINSPVLVKTADPYSTLVLSPYDDGGIPALSYPNIPAYPAGQEREVTVLKTGQTPYNWINTSFNKPKKDDLIVYEVLVRDFDARRNYQDLINKMDYFKNLKINAIQLMPIMEFEGNETWGYNTSFHMALDKFYGTSDKLKELIDLCHSNGIAVILDVALNHAFGRNPMNRMWMTDPDGDGFGAPSSDNPYFNVNATHSYNVGSDFNHQQLRTKNYVKRVVKQWISEYKIDGFRWDLTKGFTQNCPGNEGCTNTYQQDRVDVLKEYAEYSWSLDPTHYAIFEHLGPENEEKEWANFKINETPSKGVMMWGKMTGSYSRILGGYGIGSSIAGIGAKSRTSFLGKRVIGYPESHDEERIMYTAIKDGVITGTAPIRNNLNNALSRMSAIGAISLLVPGPKMIWHFADLGMDDSIYTCSNGLSVNTETDANPGNCKLDTKPQPQWTNNWLTVPARAKIYNDWAKMNSLKINEPVFEGDYDISPDGGDNLKQRIYVFDPNLPISQLKNVVVLTNFYTDSKLITPSFPFVGTWYNLMDNTTINVTDVNAQINIAAGQFLIYGNQPAVLSSENFVFNKSIAVYPNPTSTSFILNSFTNSVNVYSTTGQLVKSFNGGFDANHNFDVESLSKDLYIVKVADENKIEKSFKLIKQ